MSAIGWRPPPRPAWIQRLIGHGDAVGGAAHLVSLDPDELMVTAAATIGLDDFGAGTWRPNYDVLLRAIEAEADLHLAGRVMTRTEILRSLRARLGLTALWARDAAILERGIVAPVFVVGFARSGTSILHELLALEPTARPALTWELLHPAEAVSRDPAVAMTARRAGDLVHSFWPDVQPEYDALHHNAGDLPNECIFATAHEFLSDHWGGSHVVPTYARFLADVDHTDVYRYHRRILQTLQGDAGATQWVLKAPSHLATLATLFAVYPDARVVHIHRDPLKTVPSTLSLLGMLKWLRTDHVELGDLAPILSGGFAATVDGIIAARAHGTLPDRQFIDVRYADLIDDPGATVARVHEQLGWPSSEDVRTRARDYIAAKPKGAHGEHRYALGDFGLDAAEQRARFAAYCEHFAVPSEV